MRLSLKAKLTALIGLLVLLVVLAISALYLSILTHEALASVGRRGSFVAQEIYGQAQTVLAQSHLPVGVQPTDTQAVLQFIQSRLAQDPNLNSTIESAVGFSPTIYYAAITDTQNVVLVHNDPTQIGAAFNSAPPFDQLSNSGILYQLSVVYGPQRVYEVDLPVKMGDHPLGDVRVGVSTLFVADQLTPELRRALLLATLALVLATLSASLLSYGVLRPLKTISRTVERMARGESHEPLKVNRNDEWGILSSKLNLLGEQIRGEKTAFTRLKENLDQLFSNLTDGLLLFDRQDQLVLATPAVERFLGADPASLLQRTAGEIFWSDHPMDRVLRKAFEEREPVAWESEEEDEDGAEGYPRISASVQFAQKEGEPVGALVTVRDAGTRAQLEDQIAVATRLAALGRITSGVAHEVKNPLNAMVLQLEILKAKLAERGEVVKPQIETLSSEIRRLDRVVKTFLDFTRPVELRLSETDLEQMVREVFTLAEPQAHQNRVRLTIEKNGPVPRLKVDRDLFKQALLNLVLNGCQAMPSGGELKIRPRKSDRRVELEIADQGVGIPPDVQPRIFSLFFTTKPGGSGVGLAMAYRIIQLHNGSIDFSSEPNHGTTFRIALPA
ncbi:MAG TPA: ATP-binding protein [Terriglobia bacterium]|nr:ATP-binding protein [Terriglobia bacterium]